MILGIAGLARGFASLLVFDTRPELPTSRIPPADAKHQDARTEARDGTSREPGNSR